MTIDTSTDVAQLDALDFAVEILCEATGPCEKRRRGVSVSHPAEWYLFLNCGCIMAVCSMARDSAARESASAGGIFSILDKVDIGYKNGIEQVCRLTPDGYRITRVEPVKR